MLLEMYFADKVCYWRCISPIRYAIGDVFRMNKEDVEGVVHVTMVCKVDVGDVDVGE